MRRTLYTVGHGVRSIDELVAILKEAGVEVLIDVRSQPYSKYAAQHNQRSLERELSARGITYRWDPRLGGRPENDEYYTADGRVDYAKVADSTPFQEALEELVAEAQGRPTAIMCAEANPENCHRRRLVGRALIETYNGWGLHHLGAERIQGETAIEEGQPSLFPEWTSVHPVK